MLSYSDLEVRLRTLTVLRYCVRVGLDSSTSARTSVPYNLDPKSDRTGLNPWPAQMIESLPYRTVHILRAGNAPLLRPGRARPAASIEIHFIDLKTLPRQKSTTHHTIIHANTQSKFLIVSHASIYYTKLILRRGYPKTLCELYTCLFPYHTFAQNKTRNIF
jgi:hypothetical protein